MTKVQFNNSGLSVYTSQGAGYGGHQGSPWSGQEYGYGGGGGGYYTFAGNQGASGSIRVKWTGGSTWDSSNNNYT